MSFKDKPLKKIVSDKRITLDALHNNIINDFKIDKENVLKNKKKLNDLQKKNKNNSSKEQNHEINQLKKKIKNYNQDKEIDYYFETGELLSEYYSNKNQNQNQNQNQNNQLNQKKEINVIDIMKKNIHKPKNDLINKYMTKINDNYVSDYIIENIDRCPYCSEMLILKNIDCLLTCEKCGHTENIIINSEKISYKDPPRESSYFAYKRINHFNEWLAQFQAKETTDIPQEIYDGILLELKKIKFISLKNISYKHIRDILKKLHYNKYYEHIPHIINVLNGYRAPLLSRQHEEQLRMMFKEIQTPFIKFCPEDRKNFLSYSYVLHKFCQLIDLDDLLIYFPLLKSREKLQQQDKIWKQICSNLKWQYIPSI